MVHAHIIAIAKAIAVCAHFKIIKVNCYLKTQNIVTCLEFGSNLEVRFKILLRHYSILKDQNFNNLKIKNPKLKLGINV